MARRKQYLVKFHDGEEAVITAGDAPEHSQCGHWIYVGMDCLFSASCVRSVTLLKDTHFLMQPKPAWQEEEGYDE